MSIRKFVAHQGLFNNEKFYKIPDKDIAIQPEIRLGRIILDRALLESIGDPEDLTEWFLGETEDFETICFLAQIPSDRVRKVYSDIHPHLVRNDTVKTILANEKRLY
jgi:hypothetical protein